MAILEKEFNIGDWLIHLHYGVGQIVGIEEKNLFGEEKQFYRVRAQDDNGIYWVPVDQIADNERIRPVATRSRIEEALELLQKPPRMMDGENKIRKTRINEVRSAGRLRPIARLIRDLSARKSTQSLTQIETNALENLKKRLLAEWTVRMEIPVHSARTKLNQFLKESQSQPPRPAA